MPQHLCYERRMQRTRQPCRQLNSEGIKSTALCYLTPVIRGRCRIISAKCVSKWRIRPCQKRGQLFVKNKVCATVRYQVNIYRTIARWHHFTTTTRILQFVVFLCKLGLLFFNPQRDWQISITKQKRNEFW